MLTRPEPAFEQCKAAKRVFKAMVSEGRDRLDPADSRLLETEVYCAMGEALLALKEHEEAGKALGRAREGLAQSTPQNEEHGQLEQQTIHAYTTLRRRVQEASAMVCWKIGDLDAAAQFLADAVATVEAAAGAGAAELIVLRRHQGEWTVEARRGAGTGNACP